VLELQDLVQDGVEETSSGQNSNGPSPVWLQGFKKNGLHHLSSP